MGASMPAYGTPERTALATKAGITAGYTGTAAQNAQIVAMLNNSAPKTSPVIAKQTGVVLSADSTNALDNKNSTKLDNKITNTYGTPTTAPGAPVAPTGAAPTPTPTNANAVSTPSGQVLSDTMPSGFTYNLPELSETDKAAGKKRMYSSDGHAYFVDSKGTTTLDPVAEQEYAKNKEINDAITSRNAMYDSYKAGLDAAHVALIDGIKEKAERQRTAMDMLNKRTLGLKTVSGLRTGGAEYTPEIDAGILKQEEIDGLNRLQEIDDNMKSALAQAQSAKTAKDYAMLNERLTYLDTLQTKKENAVQQIYKNYQENTKLIMDKMKESDTLDRAKKDQVLQQFPNQSLQYQKDYNALTSTSEKNAYLESIMKTTGLSKEDILGQFQKNIGDKKKPTDGETKAANLKDLRAGMKKGQALDSNGFLKPSAWEYILVNSSMTRDELLKEFGNYMYLKDDSRSKYNLSQKELSALGY